MGKIVFVEILDKRGNIRERVKVDSFPATIGRGYANAVIIDDRLVNVEHLRLSLDGEGGMIVEDLNTVNGTQLIASGKRIEQYRVPAGNEAVIRIGQTVLRLRGDDFAVGPASLPHALFGSLGRFIENSAIASAAFIFGFGINVLAFAQEIDKKVIWSELTSMSLILLIVIAVWTGFWSFLNRLIIHSFRFLTHLAIASIASIVLLLLFTAVEYFEFFFSAPAAAKVISFFGFGVVFSLLLYGHLSVLSEFSNRKRIASSVLISIAIVGIALLVNFTKGREFSTELRFSSVMKPIGRKWVRTVSSNEFFGGLTELKAKIDAKAQEGSRKR